MAKRLKTVLRDKPTFLVLNQYVKEYGGEVDARQMGMSKYGQMYVVCPFSGCVKKAVLEKKLPTTACKEFEACVDQAARAILNVITKL